LQIKTKIVSFHTADSKPDKQEVNGTVILPPLVFPGTGITHDDHHSRSSYFYSTGHKLWFISISLSSSAFSRKIDDIFYFDILIIVIIDGVAVAVAIAVVIVIFVVVVDVVVDVVVVIAVVIM
jgi:hypothetical protein